MIYQKLNDSFNLGIFLLIVCTKMDANNISEFIHIIMSHIMIYWTLD